MREERQMLGQMINQVHQQQQELKDLQTEITNKIDANTESLKLFNLHKKLFNLLKRNKQKKSRRRIHNLVKLYPHHHQVRIRRKLFLKVHHLLKVTAQAHLTLSTSQSESSNSSNGSASNSQSPSTTVSTSEQPESTHSESTINSNSTTSSHSPNEMNTQPREEKKDSLRVYLIYK